MILLIKYIKSLLLNSFLGRFLQSKKILEAENQQYRNQIDVLRQEICRASEPMLPYLKNPLPRVYQGVGGSLQDQIRGAWLVPGWQPFVVGESQLLPDKNAHINEFIDYVAVRLPDFSLLQRQKIVDKMLSLREKKEYDSISKLLSLAPTLDVGGYQFDWWSLHSPKIFQSEFNKFMKLIDDALENNEATLSVLFMAFNFRIFLVSSVNCRINGRHFYEEAATSPFVYMMV